MLDDVRHVGIVAVDAGCFQSLIKHATGRADERLSLKIFVVPRLLANKNDARLAPALSKDSLRGILIEAAAPTILGCLAQRGQRDPRRQEFESADGHLLAFFSHETIVGRRTCHVRLSSYQE